MKEINDYKIIFSGAEDMINPIRTFQLLYAKLKYNNNIYSRRVSLKSIFGEYITVMGMTSIDCYSLIRSHTYIGYNCFITKANIGKYVSIANNVSIGMGEHKIDKVSTSSLFYDNAYETLTEKECTIGNDCWIGVDSIIRRGVKIGNGVIVGANSFVNEDIPDFAIVAGSPAKILRYRFKPEQIELISKSKWWDFDLLKAKKVIEDLEKDLIR